MRSSCVRGRGTEKSVSLFHCRRVVCACSAVPLVHSLINHFRQKSAEDLVGPPERMESDTECHIL